MSLLRFGLLGVLDLKQQSSRFWWTRVSDTSAQICTNEQR
jgi:hypothetical protein